MRKRKVFGIIIVIILIIMGLPLLGIIWLV
jgi:hypothetical protein